MPGNVRLVWEPINLPDFDHYNIYRDSGGGDVLVGQTTTISFLDRDLPDGSYTYKVSAVDTHGWEGTKSAGVVKTVPEDVTPPAAPSQLRANLEGAGIRLVWSEPADTDVAYYLVEGKIDAGGWVVLDRPTAPNFLHRDLAGNHSYDYRVSAVDKSENTSSAATLAAPITIALPTAPFDLLLTPAGANIELSWEIDTIEPQRFKYFEIVKKQSGEATFDVIGKTTSHSFTEKNVEPINADYKIRTVYVLGETADSGTIALTFTTPSTPANLRNLLAKDLNLSLYWDFDEEEPHTFEIELNINGAGWNKINESTSTSFKYYEPLVRGSSYVFRVRARDAYGQVSAYSATTTAAPPALVAPSNVRLLLEGAGVRIAWDEPIIPVQYFAVYGKIDAGGYALITRTVTANNYLNRNLYSNHTYYYKVSTIDHAGNEGPQSTEVSISIPTIPAPSAPRTEFNGNDVEFTWDVDFINTRFVAFDILSEETPVVDTFNYFGTPNTAKWTGVGAPDCDGLNCILNASGEELHSIYTGAFGDVEFEGVISTPQSAGSIRIYLRIDATNYIQIYAFDASSIYFYTTSGGITITQVTVDLTANHKFKIEWRSTSVILYIDGAVVATHTSNIIQNPAQLQFRTPIVGIVMSLDWVSWTLPPPLGTRTFIGSSRTQNFTDKASEPIDASYLIINRHVLEEETEGPISPVVFITPPAPILLRSRLQTDNDIELNWDNDEPEFQGYYEIWLDVNGGGYALVAITKAQAYIYEQTIGGGGTTYTFKVRKVSPFGQYSTYSNTTAETPP